MDIKKIFTTEKGVIDKDNNKLLGVIGSSGTIDRHGESVNPEGWIVKNFLKNPVILYGHDYSTLPVGKATKVYVENKALKFDIQFATNQFAQDVFDLFAQKILNAFSVGFIPKKYGVSGQDKFDIMEQELLELSVVTVPANPEALALVKSMEEKNKDVLVDETLKEEVESIEKIVDETLKEEVIVKEEVEEEKPVVTPEEVEPVEELKIDVTLVEEKEVVEPEEVKEEEEIKPVGDETPIIPSLQEDEKSETDAKTVALLKEVTSLFKKADNSVGQGLAILKQLKTALSN